MTYNVEGNTILNTIINKVTKEDLVIKKVFRVGIENRNKYIAV